MKLWAWLLIYLGIGVILRSALLLTFTNLNTVLGIGGLIALIGAGMYAYCQWKVLQTQRTNDGSEDTDSP